MHPVFGKGPSTNGAYRLLRTVRCPTAPLQEVILTTKTPWRGIRTLRIEAHVTMHGAGWVSWHEIEVYAAPTTCSAVEHGATSAACVRRA